MAELLIKQDDGTYMTVPITVEIHGVGTVTYPDTSTGEEDG
jgi:hypothetical protein